METQSPCTAGQSLNTNKKKTPLFIHLSVLITNNSNNNNNQFHPQTQSSVINLSHLTTSTKKKRLIFSISLAIALAALVVATHIECASIASIRSSRSSNKSSAANFGSRSASSRDASSPSLTLHTRPQKRTFATKVRAFFQCRPKVDIDTRSIELVYIDGQQALPSSVVDIEKQEESASAGCVQGRNRTHQVPPKYKRRCDAIYIRWRNKLLQEIN